MARATRSSATQIQSEKDLPSSVRPKTTTKKRKRTDVDDHPQPKQPRPVKEEEDDALATTKLQNLQLAADVPIHTADANNLLHILDLIDSQALLDRVFPLPDTAEPSSSKSRSFSLRALLKEPSQHSLRVLRAAVQNLFPISYHPRARPSSPAAQQLRFCNLACSLFDQASFHSVPVPLDIDSLLPDAPDAKPSSPDKLANSHYAKKYALMQRLPFATWWSSLSSDLVPSDTKPLKDLETANTELVAILPSPSAPPPSADASPVTLASYIPKKPPGYNSKLPGPRRVSCGVFLDYGPYASFAPVFEQDGVEVGRSAMGELFWKLEDRKKKWSDEVTQLPPDEPLELPLPNGVDKSDKIDVLDDQEAFEGLFTAEQITLLKQTLGNLDLEAAVHELLHRNAKALKRLEELQIKRLSKQGEFTPVEQGSEEWDTAQGIFDSLCLLTTLRPRSSTCENAPLIPSPSALHKLQRTLPIAPSQGWQGTLPAEHTTALRDDATLYIKSTATAIPAAPSAPTPTPTQPTPAQTTTAATAAATAQAYAGYSYNYAAPYRAGYQYKPGQPPYYPNAYAPTTAQAQATSQYYQGQPYGAAGQHQYAYSSWYQYSPQTQQTNVSAGGSRKGTPQPSAAAAAPAAAAATATTTPSTIPTSYAGFFSAASQTPGQRAVANTVASTAGGKAYQPTAGGTWTAPAGSAAGYVASTLPPHMRAAVTGQPGAAAGYNPVYQPNYYGTYQPTPSPAQS